MSILIRWIIFNEDYMKLKTKINENIYPYYEYITDILDIPLKFIIAHAQIESNQNPYALGKLNEYGLWQFLPSTWKSLMGNQDWKNIKNQSEAYIKHSKWIINTLKLNMNKKKDKEKFLWVWNAGYGNYKKNILPEITKNYIKKVLEYEKKI